MKKFNTKQLADWKEEKKKLVNELKGKTENWIKKLFNRIDTITDSEFESEIKRLAPYWNYSLYNSFILMFAGAKKVKGYKQLNDFNRYVKKGEIGIPILAPCFYNKKELNENDELHSKSVKFFKVVKVFDISQTEKINPDIEDTEDSHYISKEKLIESSKYLGINEIDFKVLFGNTHGQAGVNIDNGQTIIQIDNSNGHLRQIQVYFHEASHILLEHSKPDSNGLKKPKAIKEFEAELISFLCCQFFDIDSTLTATAYIKHWIADNPQDKEKILQKSLSDVMRVTKEIIESIKIN